jgi:ATP-binding protein involved in chromosome partitioning
MLKILVLAVKGGVGKSTVSAGLGCALSNKGFKVGFLDIDISGSNLPAALGMKEPFPHPEVDIVREKMFPIKYNGFEIFSLAFRFGTAAVLWKDGDQTVEAFGQSHKLKGSGRSELVKQILQNVEFGPLDYQIYDLPPSTAGEVLSLFENLKDIHGCILVSQPTNLSVEDIERALDMIKVKKLPLIGLVGNMTEAVCPHCHKSYYPFNSPGVDLKKFCESHKIPLLVSIPLTPDKALLESRVVELAERVMDVKPMRIWEKSFKGRLEAAVMDGAVKGMLKGRK